jgi:hypothetical protein
MHTWNVLLSRRSDVSECHESRVSLVHIGSSLQVSTAASRPMYTSSVRARLASSGLSRLGWLAVMDLAPES